MRSIILITIVLLTVRQTHCANYIKCNPPRVKLGDVSNNWFLRVFENIKYPYGFPQDFVGQVFGPSQVTEDVCNETISEKTSKECKYFFISKYCHYGRSTTEKLLKGGEIKCPEEKVLAARNKSDNTSKDYFRLSFNEYAYENLHKVIRKFFSDCANCTYMVNIGDIPMCDYTEFLKVLPNPLKSPRTITLDRSVQNIFNIYIFYFCKITWTQYITSSQVDIQTHPLCPNPCSVRLRRCSSTPNTLNAVENPGFLNMVSESNCRILEKGIYETDYMCLCKTGYLWNYDSFTCDPPDWCTNNAELEISSKDFVPLCHRKGSIRCLPYPVTEEEYDIRSLDRGAGAQAAVWYTCVCRKGYMGRRCERLRDACVEIGKPGYVSGDQACRTYLGNKCIPHNGTDYYFCKCTENWAHDPKYPFPNCYRRRSICDRVVCHNRGRCVGSEDQRTYLCVCEYGWQGRLCEIPDARQWLPWGPWTLCSAPLCGGRGWHSRSRRCRVPVNNETGFGECVGNTVEFRPCKSGCPDPLRSYVPIVKLIVFFACCLLALQATVSIIYVLLQMEFL